MLIRGEGIRDEPEEDEEDEPPEDTQTVYVIHPNFAAQ